MFGVETLRYPMEQTVPRDSSKAIRTVAWLSPSVFASAVEAAQERQQPLQHWFESAVCQYAAWNAQLAGRDPLPVDDSHRALFVQLMLNAPEALRGRWATLHEVIRADEQLWIYPTVTTGQIEDGERVGSLPRLNCKALERAWPRLVAMVFGN